MGMSNGIGTIAGMANPIVVDHITADKKTHQEVSSNYHNFSYFPNDKTAFIRLGPTQLDCNTNENRATSDLLQTYSKFMCSMKLCCKKYNIIPMSICVHEMRSRRQEVHETRHSARSAGIHFDNKARETHVSLFTRLHTMTIILFSK